MESDKSQTLFDILGVPRGATPSAINAAWEGYFVKAGGNHDEIPIDVRESYRLLSVEKTRKTYLQLLDLCDAGEVLEVRPHELEPLQVACRSLGLYLSHNPYATREYIIYYPDQAPPSWSVPTEPARFQPRPPAVWWRRIFDEHHIVQTFMVLIVGTLLLWLCAWGVHRGTVAYSDWRTRTDRQVFFGRFQAAEKLLDNLREEQAIIVEDFKKATGTYPTDGNWTPEVNPLIRTRPEFRDAWHSIASAIVSEESISKFRERLAGTKLVPEDKRPTADEVKAISKVADELQEHLKGLQSQRSNVKHVREVLETARYNRALEKGTNE